jgi:amidase
MARNVADVALLLSAIAGADDRSPISIEERGEVFARPLDRDFKGVRVAWAKDLGGLPFDSRVKQAVNAQRKAFEALGCIVEEAEPDLSGADEVFKDFRAWSYSLSRSELQAHRDLVKDTILQELDAGAKLTGPQLGNAEMKRTQLYHRMRLFLERYEFFILPVSQVPPFDVNEPYVKQIQSVRLEHYIDWMKSCYFISVLGNPAISVPCGFTPEGLPVGIQIVGRNRAEWSVLQLAHAFEQATGVGKRRPSIV